MRLWSDIIFYPCACLLAIMVLFPTLLTDTDPMMQNLDAMFHPIAMAHPMGCDWLGRDLFARVVHGARETLFLSTLVSFLTLLTGLVSSFVLVYSRKTIRSIAFAILDVMIAFPPLLMAILLASVFTQAQVGIVLALYLGSVAQVARLCIAYVDEAARSTWVEVAESLGATRTRLILVHILPAVSLPVALLFLTQCGNMILAESTLSFLGLGAPDSLSWGSLVYGGKQHLFTSVNLALIPATIIAVSVWLFQARCS